MDVEEEPVISTGTREMSQKVDDTTDLPLDETAIKYEPSATPLPLVPSPPVPTSPPSVENSSQETTRPNYKLRYMLSGHTRSVSSLKFSPDGSLLASSGVFAILRIHDGPDSFAFGERKAQTRLLNSGMLTQVKSCGPWRDMMRAFPMLHGRMTGRIWRLLLTTRQFGYGIWSS